MRNLIALVVLSLAASVAAPASAQQADAATLFRQAEHAFADEAYVEALRLFRAAYDAAPHPAVRFHVARSLERLGRLREAWIEMTEVAASPGLTGAQRRDAQRQVDRLHALLVTLRVDGAPEGAGVSVDGIHVCSLPCEAAIDPGEHEVAIADETGRASMRISGVSGTVMAVRLVIESTPSHAIEVATPEPVTPPVEHGTSPVARAPAPASPREGGDVGWLLVTGSVITAIGIAGVIGFGLQAASLHDAYEAAPTAALLHDGPLFVDLTNASIAVIAAGAVLMVIDLALALAGEGTGGHAARSDGTYRF